MLTVKDSKGNLMAHFSDYFAIVDYFLLTKYQVTACEMALSQNQIKVNDEIYSISYKATPNKRSNL